MYLIARIFYIRAEIGGYVELHGIELEIGHGDEPDTFSVQVLRSSGRPRRQALNLDVSGILGRRNDLENAVLASASRVRRAVAPDEKALREIGQQLFEAVFSGPIDIRSEKNSV